MISPNNQTNLQNQNQQGRLSNAFFIHGGRDAAMNYPVAAGYDAFLVDEDLKMFFIKSNNISVEWFKSNSKEHVNYKFYRPKLESIFGCDFVTIEQVLFSVITMKPD